MHANETAVGGLNTVLAHQGGWDEALMVLVPVAIFAALLRTAIIRADQHREPQHPDRRRL